MVDSSVFETNTIALIKDAVDNSDHGQNDIAKVFLEISPSYFSKMLNCKRKMPLSIFLDLRWLFHLDI